MPFSSEYDTEYIYQHPCIWAHSVSISYVGLISAFYVSIAVWRFICKLALVLYNCGTDLFDLSSFTVLHFIRFVAFVLLIELNESTSSVVYFERLSILQDITFILELTELAHKLKSTNRGYRANGYCHQGYSVFWKWYCRHQCD